MEIRSNEDTPGKRLYSIKEAAQYLCLSEWTVRERIWSGALAFVRSGRRVLLDIRDLERYVETNKERVRL